MAPYQGVILAAGHGSRMGPFGERVPKPIAPICNKPLLACQIDHLRGLGIDDIIIVIGHLGHVITQMLGDGRDSGVRLRYVEQEQRLGLAHAVGRVHFKGERRQGGTVVDRGGGCVCGGVAFASGQQAAALQAHHAEKQQRRPSGRR